MMDDGRSEGGFTYTSTRIAWELIHATSNQQHPSHGLPVPGSSTLEGGGLTTANAWEQVDQFTTMHPGLFAGGGRLQDAQNRAEFDYWRHTDNERFASVDS